MKLFNKEISYTWLKDNISMIILVPTLMGGLWQVIELSFIGTPYLRFFSISQLVPDGILMLFAFVLIFSIPLSVVKSMNLRDFVKEHLIVRDPETEIGLPETAEQDSSKKQSAFLKTTEEPWLTKTQGYILIALMIAIVLGLDMWFWSMSSASFQSGKSIPLLVLMGALFFTSLSVLIMQMIVETILMIHQLKINAGSRKGRKMVGRVMMTIFFVCLCLTVYLMIIFHRSFTLPNDFKNKTYLEHKIREHNPRMISADIVYYNDKYIFVQIVDGREESIVEVFKFDDFIESKPNN